MKHKYPLLLQNLNRLILIFSIGILPLTLTAQSAGISAPDAPIIGAAMAGDGQVTINFSAPGSDGGSPVTNYTVTSNPGNISVSNISSPITILGLTNGTPYTFTVTATNSAGTSMPSIPASMITPGSSSSISWVEVLTNGQIL